MKPACLAYVDDATTLAVGYVQQEKTLKDISKFAVKHKLEWGEQKCKVMEIGHHKERKSEWGLGDKIIGNCQNYKYLGEIISRDGKEAENIEEKQEKVIVTVRKILNCAKSDIMKGIGTKVILKLHNAVLIPSFYSASETWTLNCGDKKEINKIEIVALKKLFGLPPTTPTPAIVFVTGSLYAEIRVEIRQLLYLHKLLLMNDDHWAKETLKELSKSSIGWARKIMETLETWELETDWEIIARKSKAEWKNEIETRAEKINQNKLTEDCHVKERGNYKLKSKTKTIIDEIQHCNYKRKPSDILNDLSLLETRAFIMGKYGMLDCGANYAMGYGGKNCQKCGTLDDENHRINHCIRFRHINLCDVDEECDFAMIFSNDAKLIRQVITSVLSIWDLGHGKNSIRGC